MARGNTSASAPRAFGRAASKKRLDFFPPKERRLKLCHSILPIVLACVLASCSKEVAPSPDVWAVVNGTQITRQQVEKTYRSSMPADSPPPSQAEALSMKLRIVEELI